MFSAFGCLPYPLFYTLSGSGSGGWEMIILWGHLFPYFCTPNSPKTTTATVTHHTPAQLLVCGVCVCLCGFRRRPRLCSSSGGPPAGRQHPPIIRIQGGKPTHLRAARLTNTSRFGRVARIREPPRPGRHLNKTSGLVPVPSWGPKYRKNSTLLRKGGGGVKPKPPPGLSGNP